MYRRPLVRSLKGCAVNEWSSEMAPTVRLREQLELRFGHAHAVLGTSELKDWEEVTADRRTNPQFVPHGLS